MTAGGAYVALLRGVNVGGKNQVSMRDLKASFEEELGFADVSTYINSGNVLFRSRKSDVRALERAIDRMLERIHGLPGKTVVRSAAEMAVLRQVMAATWKRRTPAWRYNVMFLRHAIDAEDVLEELGAKPGIEHVVYHPGTLLWSARVRDLTRSAMVKLASRPVYREMTVRNANTATKLCELLERMA